METMSKTGNRNQELESGTGMETMSRTKYWNQYPGAGMETMSGAKNWLGNYVRNQKLEQCPRTGIENMSGTGMRNQELAWKPCQEPETGTST